MKLYVMELLIKYNLDLGWEMGGGGYRHRVLCTLPFHFRRNMKREFYRKIQILLESTYR